MLPIASLLGDTLNLAVALATAAAAYAAWRATRLTEQSATASLLHARKVATIDHVSARAETYRRLRARIGSLEDNIADEQWRDLLVLMGIWEHTAAGVNSGVFDVEVLDKMTGGNLLSTYRDYARFVRRRRRANPRIYDQLELLIDKLLLFQLCSYQIDNTSLKRLKQLGVRDDTLQRVKTLVKSPASDYHRFVVTLLRGQMEDDRNLILSCARKRDVDIVAATDADFADVVGLFERIYDVTKGEYPPASRIQACGSIQTWLELPRYDERFVARSGDSVVGYLELEDLASVPAGQHEDADEGREAYWTRAFANQRRFREEDLSLGDVMVLKRLAIHPEYMRRGLGRVLLRYGLQVAQFEHHRVPALVVLSTLAAAIQLYEAEGATRIGEFEGRSGDTLCAYVF